MGNRIGKKVTQGGVLQSYTAYALDAQGNPMATYELKMESGTKKMYLSERMIYGSSRIGVENGPSTQLPNGTTLTPTTRYSLSVGDKRYELANHLGNVLNVISDRKIPLKNPANNTVIAFNPNVIQYADYFPFGMTMPGKSGGSEYRYGFQGQEADDEIKGDGNSYNYTFRMHDPRIGRFFAVDPLTSKYPFYSPYAFSGNKVIHAIELEGLEEFVVIQDEDNYYLFWNFDAKSDPKQRGKIEYRTTSGDVIQKMRPLGVNETKYSWFTNRINAKVSSGKEDSNDIIKKANYKGNSNIYDDGKNHGYGAGQLTIEKARKLLDLKFPTEKKESIPIEKNGQENKSTIEEKTEKESKTELYNKTTFMTGYLTETDCKGNVKYLETITIPMDNKNPLQTLENTAKSKSVNKTLSPPGQQGVNLHIRGPLKGSEVHKDLNKFKNQQNIK